MTKVLEITSCNVCPFDQPGRNGRHFCRKNQREITAAVRKDTIPKECPLEDKDDYCESNFDIDRKL